VNANPDLKKHSMLNNLNKATVKQFDVLIWGFFQD
jgi:hypothetical protein